MELGRRRVRLKTEEVAKQSKRWRNSKESFVEVNKNRKLKDRVWVQMIES